MASLAQALAGVVASSTDGECDAAKQYVLFPGFFFPLTAEALTGTGPVAFDFTHRMNMVPGKPPLFMLNGRFVWSVYKRILERRELPANANPQSGYAKRFIQAETEMGDGLLSTAENTFWPVGVVPSDLAAEGNWTKVVLGPAQIESAAASLSSNEATFMERFNPLATLGDQLIERVSFERSTLIILRSWFDQSIFNERFWDLPGTTISDGLDPPGGELPGVISKLILLRNLRLKLPAATLPDIGPKVVYRTTDGSAPPPAASLSDGLRVLASAEVQPSMLAQPLSPDAGAVADQVAKTQEAAAEQLGLDQSGAPKGAQRFHVPLRFETDDAMAATKAELEKALANRDAANTALAETRARVAKIEAELASMHGTSGPFRMSFLNPLKHKLQLDLAMMNGSISQAEAEVANDDRTVERWNNAVSVLEQLTAFPEEPNPYVAAFVCDRLPKSPNPDPALFA